MPVAIEEIVIDVDLGDSIPSIAHEAGHFWETVWNYGANADLKAKRKNPNILNPGDVVTVPAIRVKSYSCGTDTRHSFKRKGVPAMMKMQLKLLGEPRANEEYTIILGDKTYRGTTDSDGNLEHPIPPNCKGGRIILDGGKEEYPVNIGHLNPIDTVSGQKQRLNNLGYYCGDDSNELTDTFSQAVTQFQGENKLKETGKVDDATKGKIESLHT